MSSSLLLSREQWLLKGSFSSSRLIIDRHARCKCQVRYRYFTVTSTSRQQRHHPIVNNVTFTPTLALRHFSTEPSSSLLSSSPATPVHMTPPSEFKELFSLKSKSSPPPSYAKIIYASPFSKAVKSMKVFSLTSMGISLVSAPVFFILADPSMPFSGKLTMAGAVAFFGIGTTVALTRFTKPYAIKVYETPIEDENDSSISSSTATAPTIRSLDSSNPSPDRSRPRSILTFETLNFIALPSFFSVPSDSLRPLYNRIFDNVRARWINPNGIESSHDFFLHAEVARHPSLSPYVQHALTPEQKNEIAEEEEKMKIKSTNVDSTEHAALSSPWSAPPPPPNTTKFSTISSTTSSTSSKQESTPSSSKLNSSIPTSISKSKTTSIPMSSDLSSSSTSTISARSFGTISFGHSSAPTEQKKSWTLKKNTSTANNKYTIKPSTLVSNKKNTSTSSAKSYPYSSPSPKAASTKQTSNSSTTLPSISSAVPISPHSLVYITDTVGIQYHKAVVRRGDIVVLSREPNNPHDPNAIKVDLVSSDQNQSSSNSHIGYIRRQIAEILTPLIDDNIIVLYGKMMEGIDEQEFQLRVQLTISPHLSLNPSEIITMMQEVKSNLTGKVGIGELVKTVVQDTNFATEEMVSPTIKMNDFTLPYERERVR